MQTNRSRSLYVPGDFLTPRYRIVAARRKAARRRVDPVQRGVWLGETPYPEPYSPDTESAGVWLLLGLCALGLLAVELAARAWWL